MKVHSDQLFFLLFSCSTTSQQVGQTLFWKWGGCLFAQLFSSWVLLTTITCTWKCIILQPGKKKKKPTDISNLWLLSCRFCDCSWDREDTNRIRLPCQDGKAAQSSFSFISFKFSNLSLSSENNDVCLSGWEMYLMFLWLSLKRPAASSSVLPPCCRFQIKELRIFNSFRLSSLKSFVSIAKVCLKK